MKYPVYSVQIAHKPLFAIHRNVSNWNCVEPTVLYCDCGNIYFHQTLSFTARFPETQSESNVPEVQQSIPNSPNEFYGVLSMSAKFPNGNVSW